MIDTTSAKKLSGPELLYARHDLTLVITAQEQMVRAGLHAPKLGQYHDEMHAVAAELRRRGR